MPIGLLNESSLHASLKAYIEPDETKYEIQYNGYIVDILRDDGVVEIQTASYQGTGGGGKPGYAGI